MMLFTIAVLLLPAVFAQDEFRCDCALYADQQMDEDVKTPLAYAVSYFIDQPLDCAIVGPPNPCAQWCNEYARNDTADGLGLCFETAQDEGQRCYGGVMCEIMYSDDHENVNDEPLRLYYRIPACPNENEEWQASGFELNEELCCDEGVYEPCSGAACSCYRYSYSYCECGLFVPEMFGVLDGNKIPLPLQVVGTNSTDQPEDDGFCDTAGGILDPCRDLCATEGAFIFNATSLADPYQGTAETYGQVFCRSLFMRADQYEGWEALNTELGVWERAPRCDMRDWYELVNTKHDERLCCDGAGDHVFPCFFNPPAIF